MMLGMPEVRPGYAPGSDRAALPAVQGIELHQDGRSMLLPVDRHLATLVPFRGAGWAERWIVSLHRCGRYPGRPPFRQPAWRAGSCWSAPPHRVAGPARYAGRGAYPGVEAHANMISGFLDGRNPVQPDYAPGFDVLQIVCTGVLLAVVLPMLGAGAAVVLSLGLLGAGGAQPLAVPGARPGHAAGGCAGAGAAGLCAEHELRLFLWKVVPSAGWRICLAPTSLRSW